MLEEEVLFVVLAIILLMAAIFKKSEGGVLMGVSAAMGGMASFYNLINFTSQIPSSDIFAFGLLVFANYWIFLLTPVAMIRLWLFLVERLRA